MVLLFISSNPVSSSVEVGALVDSYPLEDGGAIVIIYKSTDILSELVVVRVNLAGDRDDLRRIGLSSELSSDVLTKVCGGRLHLTYSVDDEILHQTVDIPDADLGFLPLVCKEAQ
jgi:hypothetical protein